ncbi:MAG TPA: DUF2905 domain-containing protein [Candidatus Polarisedimenticolia bacterium]|nr:DUF2905 domain-containing protein [Candidatus Polarisedimenticolia bacterium]
MTPDPLPLLGRILMLAGLVLIGFGALLIWGPRLPGLGRLPGDLVWRRDGLRVYVPITTSLLISLILTVLFALLSRFRR